MDLVYNKEGNIRFSENEKLCDMIEKTHNVEVIPALGPVGLTKEGDIFECMIFPIGDFSENMIADMEGLHNIDAKKELTLAALSGFISGRNHFGGEPFVTMYAFEFNYRDSVGDGGIKMKHIVLRAALR